MIIGPRSTRQSNPEEHASQYFNTFSKDMLVQVRFKKIDYKVVLCIHKLKTNPTNLTNPCMWAHVCVGFCLTFSHKHFILLIPCSHTSSLNGILHFFMFRLLFPVVSALKTTARASQRLSHLHTLCNLPCHTPNCQCSAGK